jgi:hypothetical protein
MGAAFCNLAVEPVIGLCCIKGRFPASYRNLRIRILIMRTIPVLALTLALLSGCSYFNQGGNWAKPGTDPDQALSDLDSCEAEARAQTKVDRGIDQDIAATQGTGAFGDPTAETGMSGYQSAKRYDDIVESCMQAFGYARQ